ncbi:MAG: hypothetical protein ACR2IK_06200 [Chloroflexota bacterium]
MQNSPRLPLAALVAAAVLACTAVVERRRADPAAPLSELDIGLAAWAFVLAVFGAQGMVSILLEGQKLRLGTTPARLTWPLTWAVVFSAAVLLVLSCILGGAILTGQSVAVVGATAGAGCLVLAFLLVAYKEAFVGDEARLDSRKDGIPW